MRDKPRAIPAGFYPDHWELRPSMTQRIRGLISVLLIAWVLFFQNPAAAQDSDPLSDPSLLSRSGAVRVLIVPVRHAVLASEISARIKTIAVDVGDKFNLGQPLVVLDTGIYQARAQRAKAEFDAAQKSLAIHTKLSTMGSVSELEMVGAQARIEAARAELDLEQIQVNLGTIFAPFNGWVVKRLANPHEYVTPGQPVMEVIDQQLKLKLHVPSIWLAWLKPGIEFKVVVDETKSSYSARITQLGGRIDPVSQTMEVWAKIIGKHGDLVAGMSGVCLFPDRESIKP